MTHTTLPLTSQDSHTPDTLADTVVRGLEWIERNIPQEGHNDAPMALKQRFVQSAFNGTVDWRGKPLYSIMSAWMASPVGISSRRVQVTPPQR